MVVKRPKVSGSKSLATRIPLITMYLALIVAPILLGLERLVRWYLLAFRILQYFVVFVKVSLLSQYLAYAIPTSFIGLEFSNTGTIGD
jgi:hypothetical protein